MSPENTGLQGNPGTGNIGQNPKCSDKTSQRSNGNIQLI